MAMPKDKTRGHRFFHILEFINVMLHVHVIKLALMSTCTIH